jgi:hypothetical protein
MNRFMVWLTACFAVFAVVLLIFGAFSEGARLGRMRIGTRQDSATLFTVTITLRDVTPEYRWLAVFLCTAEIDAENQTRCNGNWEGESGRQVYVGQSQYPVPFRNVPRGTLWVFAMAFDAEKKALARNQATVLR